jgi:RNA polymerase sigma-70 factor (ECF subfamily)
MNRSENLIARARAGEQEAFRLIFERYSRPVLGFIYDLVSQRDLAEELTQETFVRAYHNLKELRDEARFSTWLFGIGRNVAREALRLRRRDNQEFANDEELLQKREDTRNASPADHLLEKELNLTIETALRSLDEDKRVVFALKTFHQRSYLEIAEITGFSLAKVKTDLHRARVEMRRRIRPYLETSQ